MALTYVRASVEGFTAGDAPTLVVRVGEERFTLGAESGPGAFFTTSSVGKTLVLTRADDSAYQIADAYRLPGIFGVLVMFIALALWFGRWRAGTSLVGLVVSIAVLAGFLVPRIAGGADPLATTLIASGAILAVSLPLAHGFSRRTGIALLGTIIALVLGTGLAKLFVALGKLTGTGSEEAFMVQTSSLPDLNLSGLLLAGIIIGVLGVLDDVTTTQAAAVDEIRRADPSLSPRELYRRGLSVGREHIAALINTLALAYAGAALPLFLLFVTSQEMPFWVVANSEFVVEEIIRTLVGSAALILAVPITTVLASRMLTK